MSEQIDLTNPFTGQPMKVVDANGNEVPVEQIEVAPTQDAPPANEPAPTPDPANDPAPAADPAPAPDPASAPSFDFSKFGVQSEDELSQRLSSVEEMSKKLSEYEGKQKEYDVFQQVRGKIQAPYADETIAKLNDFVKKTGISDHGVALQMIRMTPEEAATNPAKALAYKEVLENPDVLKFTTLADIEAAIASKYDIEDGESVGALTKLEVAKAQKVIQEKLANVQADTSDVFVRLQQEAHAQAEAFQQAQERATQDAEKAVSRFSSLSVKVGEDVFNVSVRPEVLSQVKEATAQFAAYLPVDENYQKTVDNYIQNLVRTAEFESILSTHAKHIEGKKTEEAVKSAHNGQPVVRKDAPASTQAEESPHIVAAKARLRALGHNV